MRRVPRFALPAAVLALLAGAPAGPARADTVQQSATSEVRIPTVTLPPGGSAEARVTVTVREGNRLIADPPPNKFTLGLQIVFEGAHGVHAEQPAYPTPGAYTMEDGFKYQAYEGTLVITIPIKAAPSAVPGTYTLQGHIRYQPIRLGSFKKRVVLPLEMEVKVAGAKPDRSTRR